MGTPDYSAPEQIAGQPVDGRADQYALACVAFSLLAGTVPFARADAMAALYAHVNAPAPTLTAARPDLPAAVDGVMAKAMAKNPADRYESCAAFARALRGALGVGSDAFPVTPAGPPGPFSAPGHEATVTAGWQGGQAAPGQAGWQGSPAPTGPAGWPAPPATGPAGWPGPPASTGPAGWQAPSPFAGPAGWPGPPAPAGSSGWPGAPVPPVTFPPTAGGAALYGAAPPGPPWLPGPGQVCPGPGQVRRPPRRNTGLIAGLSAGAAVLVAGIIAIVALAGQRGEPSGSSGAGAAPSATAGIASLVATLTAPDGALMRNAFFSADGKYLAAASTAADVYVWNAGTHQRIATVSVGTGDQADPVGFSADDQTLYVIDSAGKQLYDFDVATGKAANVYTLPSGSMWGDTWDSGVLVAYTSGGAVGIYDMATGKLDAQLKNPGNSPVAAVRPDGDGKYVVISDEDGEAYLVASSGTVAGTFGYTYSATGASYPGISLKGKTVYVPGGPKGAAKLWDRTTGAYVTPAGRQWPKLDNGITFSNDSRFVITSPDLSSDVVDTWGIATRAHVATVTVPGSANQELLSVAPGAGEILATGSLDASAGTFSELSIWQIP